jgi:hypothetical protein
MLFLLKTWQFIKKYWQAFVGLIILMAGVVLGTSGKRVKVLEKDKEALKKQNKNYQVGLDKIVLDNKKATDKAIEKRDDAHKKIDKAASKKTVELKNNSKKLDEELKSKYNLKKG